MNPFVGIVILTHNNSVDAITCVRSFQQCTYPSMGMVLVDNSSSDDTVARVREQFPTLTILDTGKNLGYTGGNNLGIRHWIEQGVPYILAVNNDTQFEPGFLEPLIQAMEDHPDAAAACGKVLYEPEREVVQYAGGDLIRWRSSGFSRGDGTLDDPNAPSVIEEVTFLHGCAILMRTSHAREHGGFDERLFMYCEDTEFSLRATLVGKKLLYVSSARIYHRMEHRADKPVPFYFMSRNRLLLAEYFPSRTTRVIAQVYFLGVTLAKMVYWRFKRPDLYLAVRMGLEDYRRRILFRGRAVLVAEATRELVPAHVTSKKTLLAS